MRRQRTEGTIRIDGKIASERGKMRQGGGGGDSLSPQDSAVLYVSVFFTASFLKT